MRCALWCYDGLLLKFWEDSQSMVALLVRWQESTCANVKRGLIVCVYGSCYCANSNGGIKWSEHQHTHTIQFTQSCPELIALLQHLLATPFNKCVELDRERAHALAQIFKVEVH